MQSLTVALVSCKMPTFSSHTFSGVSRSENTHGFYTLENADNCKRPSDITSTFDGGKLKKCSQVCGIAASVELGVSSISQTNVEMSTLVVDK